MRALPLAVLLLSSLALAAPQHGALDDTGEIVMPTGVGAPIAYTPRFIFKPDGYAITPTAYVDLTSEGDPTELAHPVVSHAIDGTEVWVAADTISRTICGMAECQHEGPSHTGHVTVLFDHGRPVAWHYAYAVTAAQQAKAVAAGTTPPAIPRRIDPGAEAVVKKFEATIGSARTLANTVSQRNDVVLFGSDARERTVGGNQVRAQLLAWKLGFKVRDGVQAGITSSKQVAWVAANLDAARPGDKKPTPYRALFIYEKHADTGWDIVQLHFSYLAGS